MLSRLGKLPRKLKSKRVQLDQPHLLISGSCSVSVMLRRQKREANQVTLKHRSVEYESSMTPVTLSLSLARIFVLLKQRSKSSDAKRRQKLT